MSAHSWLVIGIAAGAAALIGCGQEPAYQKPLTPVAVQVVARASPAAGTRYSVSLSPATQVDLAFKVGGYVNEIQQVHGPDDRLRIIQPGDTIHQGAVLARLRESDYAVKLNQATSNEADAKANYTQAKLDFERAQNLYAAQSLTKSDYDAARARYDSAQAKLRGATESRKEAGISMQDSTLKAPLDGVVLKRNIEVGSLVSAGTVAFVMADTSTVKALFGVPDITMERVTLGQYLTVTMEAIPGAGFQGQVTKIDPSADATSRVFQIEVKVPNVDNKLKPGMIAVVSLPDGRDSTPGLIVPLSAIVRPPGGAEYAVYVVDEQEGRSLVHQRPVKLGPVLGNNVIVSEGLAQGQTIVVKGTNQIVDGEQVRVLSEAG
ncbi:MAG: efflux RND transporter periplasmic adaptor subunit [Nitrospiraceae bacterium]